MSLIVNLTHDIDFIQKTYQYITHDLLKLRIANLARVFNKQEPFWTFDKIMRIEDKAGCRSTFFFLEESIPWNPFRVNRWNLTMGKYKFSNPKVSALLRVLHSDGWEIALHGSFKSYRSKELLGREKENLEASLGGAIYGVRQHFLNVDIPYTWKIQREAGFLYDASLGRRGSIGFHQNHYHPLEHKSSGMVLIPLTIMDSYLKHFTKGDLSKAWPAVLKIIDEAEANNGVLSILWHNNFFNENEQPGFGKLYNRIIWECRNRGAEFLTSLEVCNRFRSDSITAAVTDNKNS